MPDVVRIVDAISASPTTLLDLNDFTSWWTKSFKAPPPRLRRSVSENALRDGAWTSAASYGERIVTLELDLRKTTQDLAATELQKLFRLLDQGRGLFLQYQPQGATKPVFFVLQRADVSDLLDVPAQAAMRGLTVELPAEPFALGLKESLGPFTINNNPAAGSNPCYAALPTIIGDVPAPLVLWDNPSGGSTYTSRLVAVHASSTAATVTGVTTLVQAESMTPGGIDGTTNPGGGPDAAMSGTGTNNYLRTSFTNASLTQRAVSGNIAQNAGGTYRILAAIRRSDATSAINVQAFTAPALGGSPYYGEKVATPASANRCLVDLGLFAWPAVEPAGESSTLSSTNLQIVLMAERTSGGGTLDWDCLIFVPAGGQYQSLTTMLLAGTYDNLASGTQRMVLDGVNDQAWCTNATTDPTTTSLPRAGVAATGGFPMVVPGATNRLYVLSWAGGWGTPGAASPLGGSGTAQGVATTTTVTGVYWPRYLFVRPATT